MFPSHSPQQRVIAQQLAAELAEYDRGLGELLLLHWDPQLYRSLSDRFDRIEMLVNALPRLASRWTEFLISRVDLTHALWSVHTPSRISGKVVAMHARHRMFLLELASLCGDYAEPWSVPSRVPAAADGPSLRAS